MKKEYRCVFEYNLGRFIASGEKRINIFSIFFDVLI